MFFANTPSKKYDSSATIRDLYLKSDLENEKYSIESEKCTSIESLPTKAFKKISNEVDKTLIQIIPR